MTRINETFRKYKDNDPYYFKVDNLPLEDLLKNDIALQTQIDILGSNITVTREVLQELKPYVSDSSRGRVYVAPGNFISRIQTPSTRQTGDKERDYSLPKTDGVNYTNSEDVNRRGGGIGRLSLVRFLQKNGEDQFIIPETFLSSDFQGEAPLGRLDLVFIRADGSFDSADEPKLGIIKGGGLTENFLSEPNGTRWSDFISGGVGTKGKTVGTGNQEIPANSKGLTGENTLNPEFGTIPLPDDLINYAVWNADNAVATYIQDNENNGAAFGIPICYVWIPNTFVEGSKIESDWIIDIRPLFRSAELTIDERQAIMASTWKPTFNNPFSTKNELLNKFASEVNRNKPEPVQDQIDTLAAIVNTFVTFKAFTALDSQVGRKDGDKHSAPIELESGDYLAFVSYNASVENVNYNIFCEREDPVLGWTRCNRITSKALGATPARNFSKHDAENNEKNHNSVAILSFTLSEKQSVRVYFNHVGGNKGIDHQVTVFATVT